MGSFISRIFGAVSDNLISGGAYYTILKGIAVTLAVTLMAWLFAVIVGVAVSYLVCYDKAILSGLGRALCFIFRSVPVLLTLWLLYYCVLDGAPMGGMLTVGLAVGLYGGGHVAELLARSVKQAQEGLSRGIKSQLRRRYYFTVIPQALEDSLFELKRLSVLMLQWTTVAGYISVNDLTQVMYGIGHRTMYPFFSIAFTAICYLLAVALTEFMFELIGRKLNKEA